MPQDHFWADGNNPLQLKLLVTNSTLFIFSWDRVEERRVRVSPRLCCFSKCYGVSTNEIYGRISISTAYMITLPATDTVES